MMASEIKPSGRPSQRSGRPNRSGPHLAFIRKLPCASCGRTPVQAAHINRNDASVDRRQMLSRKADDKWTVPLCVGCHQTSPEAQHRGGEEEFWRRLGINESGLAAALFEITGDEEKGRELVAEARRLFPHAGAPIEPETSRDQFRTLVPSVLDNLRRPKTARELLHEHVDTMMDIAANEVARATSRLREAELKVAKLQQQVEDLQNELESSSK